MEDDFRTELKLRHNDEQKDVITYEELATEAEKHGHNVVAGILHDIAHEEKTHAAMLAHILEMEVKQ